MGKHVLITGGAGFVGSYLATRLVEQGNEVRVLDNLCSQVHGKMRSRPQYLTRDVELIEGDIRDPDVVYRALSGVDTVFHLAAAIGGRQSMRQISHFVEINNLGTAVLLEAVVEQPIERLVLSSSMAVYGEGLYRSAQGKDVTVPPRGREQLRQGKWEAIDAEGTLTPMPTPETKTPSPESIYAVSKLDQEQMCLMMGAEYDIPVSVLRLFNVYGPRQLPGNAYTGELSAFASCLCAGVPPTVDEDGCQLRDWVSVHDVVQALELAMDNERAVGQVFNVGSGTPYSLADIAQAVADAMGMPHMEPEATGQPSQSCVRHCFADISKAGEILGYEPRVTLEAGFAEMAEWFSCRAMHGAAAENGREHAARGLVV